MSPLENFKCEQKQEDVIETGGSHVEVGHGSGSGRGSLQGALERVRSRVPHNREAKGLDAKIILALCDEQTCPEGQ